jgi:hypothetical protein
MGMRREVGPGDDSVTEQYGDKGNRLDLTKSLVRDACCECVECTRAVECKCVS